MGFIRSEEMHLFKFLVTKDAAYQTIKNFGKTSSVHFLNMNKYELQSFNLPYTDMIKRSDETTKRLMYFSFRNSTLGIWKQNVKGIK